MLISHFDRKISHFAQFFLSGKRLWLGNWDNFRDVFRVAPWTDVFSKSDNDCATEVTSWLSVGINTIIPSRKYQIKLHSSPWFSPACIAAIAHRNCFYHMFQCDRWISSSSFFSPLLVITVNQ